MVKFITEADIKPAFKFATGATKKLVTAGVTAADNFPELLSKYKWSGTRDYNMAMILIAFYAYCAQQDDPDIQAFGMSAKRDKSKKSVFEFLENGEGKKLHDALHDKNFENVMGKVLENVVTEKENNDGTKGTENRDKIISNFLKQIKKITPWKINDRDVELCILQLTDKIQGQNEAVLNGVTATLTQLLLKMLDQLKKETKKLANELKTNKEISEKQIKELESKLSQTKTTLANLGKKHNINTAALNDIMKKHPDLNEGIIGTEIETIAKTKEFKDKIVAAQKATEELENGLEAQSKRRIALEYAPSKRRIANEKEFNRTNPQGPKQERRQSMVQNRVSFFEKKEPIKPRSNTNTANAKLNSNFESELKETKAIIKLSQELSKFSNQYNLKALRLTDIDTLTKLYNKKETSSLYFEDIPAIKTNPEKDMDQYLKELKTFAEAIKNHITAGGNDTPKLKDAMQTFGESTATISDALKNIKFYIGKEQKSSVFTGSYPYRYIYFSKKDEPTLKNGSKEGIKEYKGSYYYKNENKTKAEEYLENHGGYIINI